MTAAVPGLAAMDTGTPEAVTVEGDRLVRQADGDALRDAAPPPGTILDADGFRIVPGSLRSARSGPLANG